MKNQAYSWLNPVRNKTALVILAIAVVVLSISISGGGIGGLVPAETAYFAGIVLFYTAVLMLWRNVKFYFMLILLFLIVFSFLWLGGIGLLVKLFPHGETAEDISWSIGFACFAGVISGITGIVRNSKGWQRLPYAGAALSMFGVLILAIPCFASPPGINLFLIVNSYLLLALQVLMTIALLVAGIKDRNAKWPSKTVLIITLIVLIALVLWNYLIAGSGPVNDRGIDMWRIEYFLVSGINLIITVLAFFALRLFNSKKFVVLESE